MASAHRRVKPSLRKDTERTVCPPNWKAEDAACGDSGRRDAAIAFDTSHLASCAGETPHNSRPFSYVAESYGGFIVVLACWVMVVELLEGEHYASRDLIPWTRPCPFWW